ncbi:hypothetical protein [Oribacterium sp. WCC10]|uniref:hypothetical protein n=1 Tax=Oribacterium sp. WCC10 TaxID=1855343 RepID=UPI0008EAF66B|nr:hypothetical protein [Oribacterium sp. WCC10]SFG10415.1 hypothetical protein SAMN05216356_101267 [Oribacterium sp. WCC10]
MRKYFHNKRIIFLLMAICTALTVTSCKKNDSDESSVSEESSDNTESSEITETSTEETTIEEDLELYGPDKQYFEEYKNFPTPLRYMNNQDAYKYVPEESVPGQYYAYETKHEFFEDYVAYLESEGFRIKGRVDDNVIITDPKIGITYYTPTGHLLVVILNSETSTEETTAVDDTSAAFDKDAFVKKAIEITADNFKDSQRLDNVSKGQLVYFSGSVNGHNTSEKDDCLLINLSDKTGDAKLLVVTWNNVDLTQFNDNDIVTVYGEYVGESEWGTGTPIVVANDKVEAQHIVVTGKASIYGPDKKFFEENHDLPTPVYLVGSDRVKYDPTRTSSYSYCSAKDNHDENESWNMYVDYYKGLKYFGYKYIELPNTNGRVVEIIPEKSNTVNSDTEVMIIGIDRDDTGEYYMWLDPQVNIPF